MFIEKGLEQRFRAFFQFFDDICNWTLAAIKLTECALEKSDTLRREFVGVEPKRMKI